MFLLMSSSSACFGFESRAYEQNETDFGKLHRVWLCCDELLYCRGDDKFSVVDRSEPDDKNKSDALALRHWNHREGADGKPLSFTGNEVLELLKNKPLKDILVIILSMNRTRTTESLHQIVRGLEPFVAAVGYKRVLVLSITSRGVGTPYGIVVLKDTLEDDLNNARQKDQSER